MNKQYHSPLRRIFLKAAGILPLLLTLPAPLRAALQRAFPTRTVEQDVPMFSPETGLLDLPDGTNVPYSLIVDGLVENRLVLSYQELTALPAVKQVSDFHCVEGWSVNDVEWHGFRVSEILTRARPLDDAKHIVFHALGRTPNGPDGLTAYVESMPISALTDDSRHCLMALGINGKPLTHDRGAPLRLVAPYQLAYKSIKYVYRMEITNTPRDGWWTAANPIYPRHAPVPKERLNK